MSVKNDNNIKPGAIIALIILMLSATGAGALPILIIAGIGYAAFAYIKKQSEEQGTSMSETVKKKSAEMMNKFDEIEESGGVVTISDLFSDARRKQSREANASSDDSARKHMESKFDVARRRQKNSSDGETIYSMLSRSEQTHYDSFSSDFHDEYTHRSNELKDLLHAGIIDSAEYKDRMAQLKAELKK